MRVRFDGYGNVGAHGDVCCERFGQFPVLARGVCYVTQLTKLARIERVKQLTQERPSIEKLDVLLDHFPIVEAQVPSDLVTERSCETRLAAQQLTAKNVRYLRST